MAKRNRFFEDEMLSESFKGKMLVRVLGYVKPYRKTLIGVMVIMLVMGFVALLPPLFNRLIVDNVFTKQGNYVRLAIGIIVAWVAVAVSEVVFTFFRARLMTKTGYKIVRDIRRDIFYNIQRLSFDYFDSRPAGKILVRVTTYVDDLANVFSNSILTILFDTVKMLLVTVWLLILEPRLALVAIIAMVPLCAALFTQYHFLHKRSRVVRNKISNRTAYIAENINGSFVTKAFNRADLNTKIYDDLNRETNSKWLKFIRLNETIWPSIDFFWTLGTIAVYCVILWLIGRDSSGNYNGITIGLMSSFLSYMNMYVGPLNNIASQFQQLSVATSNIERIFEVIDTEPSVLDKPDAYTLPPISGEVAFQDVTFAYDKGINILEHFSLEVPAGKCIALVGPTGAGKSTVVNLLSRFYDVTEGRITVDGHDISGVTLRSLREQVGVMMQDSFIFGGTIIDNIRFGRPDATDAECIAAAEAVFASEFITRLPDGYYQKTGEQGAGLSTGERQLLSFARTILADPKILILDEATSSVDSQTEARIQEALNVLLKNRTSFVIAHRLSTIKRADCILYISDKGIKEAGTHEELMERGGAYYTLAINH